MFARFHQTCRAVGSTGGRSNLSAKKNKVFHKGIYLSDELTWVWEPKNRRNWASQSSEDSSTEHFHLNTNLR